MKALLLSAALLLPSAGEAATGAEFLRLGAGARALGLGEAYGPLAGGAEAVYWNPAGLASGARELAYSRSELFGLVHHDFAAYCQPLAGGAFGAALTRLSQEPVGLVTNANIAVGQFSPHSEAASVGYARGFLDGRLAAGMAVKAITETLHDESAAAFAADGGLLWRPRLRHGPRFSATFRNLGTREKFVREADDLPLEFGLGGAASFAWGGARLTPALEAAFPARSDPFVKLGAEWASPVGAEARAALRLGYKTLTVAELGALSGLTAGVGAGLGRISFDFAFQPLGVLGEAYRFSLAYAW